MARFIAEIVVKDNQERNRNPDAFRDILQDILNVLKISIQSKAVILEVSY